MSPPEGAESDQLPSDIQEESDSQTADASVAPCTPTLTASLSTGNRGLGKQATRQSKPGIRGKPGGRVEEAILDTRFLREVARSKAIGFEQRHRNWAEKRICDGFFKAFHGDKAAGALEVLSADLYDSAVDAEMRQHGSGVRKVIRDVERSLASISKPDQSKT